MGTQLSSDGPTGYQGKTAAERLVTSDTAAQVKTAFPSNNSAPQVSSVWRKCDPMLTLVVPMLSSIAQLGIFFAAAAALVVGMLGIR